jgi:multiple sugar transport system ATP-binding protein
LGADTFLHVQIDGTGTLAVRATGEAQIAYGDQVYLTPDPAKIHLFDKDGEAIR